MLEPFTLALVLYQLGLWLIGFLLLWRIPRCREASATRPNPGPSVSVIIPARNEERNLPALLQSLDAQDLQPVEVIVVDDGSEDGTAKAARLHEVRILDAGEKPPDWVGKPWACWKGALAATGEILVFLDADTVLSKSGLARIVATLAAEEGVISIQPFHAIRTSREALSAYFNLVAMAALNVFSPLGDRLRPAGSFGPCIAVRRAEYFAAGGHEAVKSEITEDMALGGVFQDRGVRVSCFGGKGSVSFRMYSGGVGDIAEGWTKNFALGAARTHPVFVGLIVAWIAGSTTCFLSLLATLLPGFSSRWPVEVILYALYAAQLFWMLRRIGSFGPLAALLFPLPLLFFHAIFFRSLFLARVRNRVTWRGRTIGTRRGARQIHE